MARATTPGLPQQEERIMDDTDAVDVEIHSPNRDPLSLGLFPVSQAASEGSMIISQNTRNKPRLAQVSEMISSNIEFFRDLQIQLDNDLSFNSSKLIQFLTRRVADNEGYTEEGITRIATNTKMKLLKTGEMLTLFTDQDRKSLIYNALQRQKSYLDQLLTALNQYLSNDDEATSTTAVYKGGSHGTDKSFTNFCEYIISNKALSEEELKVAATLENAIKFIEHNGLAEFLTKEAKASLEAYKKFSIILHESILLSPTDSRIQILTNYCHQLSSLVQIISDIDSLERASNKDKKALLTTEERDKQLSNIASKAKQLADTEAKENLDLSILLERLAICMSMVCSSEIPTSEQKGDISFSLTASPSTEKDNSLNGSIGTSSAKAKTPPSTESNQGTNDNEDFYAFCHKQNSGTNALILISEAGSLETYHYYHDGKDQQPTNKATTTDSSTKIDFKELIKQRPDNLKSTADFIEIVRDTSNDSVTVREKPNSKPEAQINAMTIALNAAVIGAQAKAKPGQGIEINISNLPKNAEAIVAKAIAHFIQNLNPKIKITTLSLPPEKASKCIKEIFEIAEDQAYIGLREKLQRILPIKAPTQASGSDASSTSFYNLSGKSTPAETVPQAQKCT